MYERFTDRARKTMQLANQTAQRFNHEYIGTEHILIGLCKEGSGVAANALRNFGIEFALEGIIVATEKMMEHGPDMVTMGKLPQTPRAKKVIEFAMEEAKSLGHNYVSTEHILLGLLREQEGIAAQALNGLGVTIEKFRAAVVEMLTEKNKPMLLSGSSVSPAIKQQMLDILRQGFNDILARVESLDIGEWKVEIVKKD